MTESGLIAIETAVIAVSAVLVSRRGGGRGLLILGVVVIPALAWWHMRRYAGHDVPPWVGYAGIAFWIAGILTACHLCGREKLGPVSHLLGTLAGGLVAFPLAAYAALLLWAFAGYL